MDVRVRSALTGAATGLRSSAGLGILIEAREPGLPAALRTDGARAAAAIGIVSELLLDKLPQTPSRLKPRGLVTRVGAATAAGAFIARGAGLPLLPAAVTAGTVSLAAAKLGHTVRVARPSLLTAVIEDAIALSLGSNAA